MPGPAHNPTGAAPARTNTIRTEGRELANLLDALETGAGDGARHREFARWPFRAEAVLVRMHHPGGTEVEVPLACRNLSCGGLALLHSAFVHPGTRAVVDLPLPRGGGVPVHGQVVRCRHVSGVVHEIGVRFDHEIDLHAFLRPHPGRTVYARERIDPAALRGSVLLIEPDDADARQIGRVLGPSSVRLHRVASAREGLQELRRHRPDLLVVSAWLPDLRGAELIAALRGVGVTTPVVLTAPATDPLAPGEAQSTRASALLAKPIEPDGLLRVLAETLPRAPVGAGATRAPGKPAPGTPDAACLLAEHADELDQAVLSGNVPRAYAACQQVRTAARMLTLPWLADAAGSIGERLATRADTAGMADELTALARSCRAA